MAPKGQRPAIFPGTPSPVGCQVFERGALPVGTQVPGPATIEDHESTTIVPPGAKLRIDSERMIILDISGVSL